MKNSNKMLLPVAMLLEGKFTSLYKNRVIKSTTDSLAAQGSHSGMSLTGQ